MLKLHFGIPMAFLLVHPVGLKLLWFDRMDLVSTLSTSESTVAHAE